MFGIVFCNNLKSNAQTPPNLFGNITIASPNAAALGKYGDYPVGYHTGVPQINIPIYNVKEGSLSLPISLSYHASGLKVMEPASWVGAGWNLNAGGAIIRSVVGQPDDRAYLGRTTHGHFSHYGYNSYNFVQPGGGSGSPTCYSYPEESIALVDDGQFRNGFKDGEPDLFFFNFGSYSGKFYFRDDRTAVIVPEADFKIEPIINTYANILGFTITTTDGTKYSFGQNQVADGNIDAIEKTSPLVPVYGMTYGSATSSWYLNKITSSDNKSYINLIYQADNYSYYTFGTNSDYQYSLPDNSNKFYTLVKNFMDGVRLSSINFSTGKVLFLEGAVRTDLGDFQTPVMDDNVNTNSKSLGAIKITDNQNACRNFAFNYGYFEDNITPLPAALSGISSTAIVTDTKRLKLVSVQEQNCNNAKNNPPYTFDYTTGANSFVPRRLSFAQDHWGYNNGKSNNASLLPTYSVNSFEVHEGADRESFWPEMSYGSLNKITYPTGGNTQFLFEPNSIWTNYTYYNHSLKTTSSIGPAVGNPNLQQINLTTTANRYKIVLDYYTSSSGNSTGATSIFGLTVNKSNPHNEIVFLPGAGPHQYELSQNSYMSSSTGDYATAKIYEEIPSNFQDNKVIGGLRIKSITNNDNLTLISSVSNYNYNSGAQSSGILYSRPTYLLILRNDILKTVGVAGTGGCDNTDGCMGCAGTPIILRSPGNIIPMSTSQGNHIGYNYVEVTQNNNGKSVYQYYGSNIWDQNQNDVFIKNIDRGTCNISNHIILPNYPPAPVPNDFMRGELSYEAHYNQSGNLLKNTLYTPVFTENAASSTPSVIHTNFNLVSGPTFYNLTTSKKTKFTTVSNYFQPGSSNLQTTTEVLFYESPFHNQVTRKTFTNSLGETLETKIKYAFDYRIPNCEAISDCYQSYASSYANILSNFNTALYTCVPVIPSCNCRYPAFQSYRYQWSVARKNYVQCRLTNFMGPNNTFQTNHDNAKANADGELKPILELQDKYINPPIETTMWKAGKLTGASYNKYDYLATPNGNVYPNKLQVIKVAASSTIFTASASNNTTITKDSRYTDEELLQYENSNVVKILSKNGIAKSYVWDYNFNMPIAETINAEPIDIGATSFEADGKGNFSFTGVPILSPNVPTGKKVYPLTGNNITKLINSTKIYIITLWADNSGVLVNGSGPIKIGRSLGAYTNYEYQVANNVLCTISGNGYIDELRLYPSNAQMSSYTYDPLVGMTSATDANNHTKYYEYDSFNRLAFIRDQDNNILKKICYNYAGQVEDCTLTSNTTPVWRGTGQTRCQPCASNPNFNSGVREKEEKDINPSSLTANSSRWVVDPSGTCPSAPPIYQPRNDLAYCEQISGINTGNFITPTWDANQCSSTYNTNGPSIITPNHPPCMPCTIPCNVPQYKCINGVCTAGLLKVVKFRRINKFTWECYKAWCFPDGSLDGNNLQTFTSSTPCDIECF